MKNEQKTKSVDKAKSIFAENSVVVVLNYKGLNAKGVYSLRRKLKSKNANIKVLKNTLVKKAISDNVVDLVPVFKDQVAISFSNDPVSLSSVLIDFTKENESVSIQTGFMDGKLLSLDSIKSLASLGSFDEVRARFIGLLKAPGSTLARTLVAQETKLKETAN
jgi:large subunit ribosomal protein L10